MEDLIEIEDRFQSYLQKNDYTFIGPVNTNLFQGFAKNVNMLAPVVAISRSIHHALSHTASVRRALNSLQTGTELRIYVVIREHDSALIHATIEDYCETYKIEFKQ
ncbi:hypothetical protein [Flavivirga spongiicola]|uniref:Uncharacterized protein n=1 Tax=Flavivirga spongiicola TaxID=421621 RepID=A0ABU7Y011_9FLAO|nr:hypothetical protein [Flavivirga sp. MEBiC05379]MDO5980566.1 hypothetical protein [Flavivirga sp. MEBiC05379]